VKTRLILLAAASLIALPFLARRFTRPTEPGGSRVAPASLVIVSPHNEAIRQEMARAFSRWHEERYGHPVKIDWLVIGGTTEISRYLNSEFISAVRAWRSRSGLPWPAGAAETLLDPRAGAARKAVPGAVPEVTAEEKVRADLAAAYRSTDDPAQFTTRIDLFFGGGQFDHARAFKQGMTVAPWPPEAPPPGLLTDPDGTILIPERVSGEIWRSDTYFGTVVSTFGICFNPDRLRELGVEKTPRQWRDLADPRYRGQIAVADPTKSGSIAKAFEMLVQQQCAISVRRAGFTAEDTDRFEAAILAARLPRGEVPGGVPPTYQAAVEAGWLEGLRLIRRIAANARYFTDAASKVPLDVSQGQAAAGLAIDFYARYQAQCSRAPDGRERMGFITPEGGSSVSADPVSLLRGAEHREVAVRFIEFLLGEAGQRIWTYRAGEPGGPEHYTLRRLPIRRDFYPSASPGPPAAHERHLRHASDDLASPEMNPYALAERFIYRERWTGQHFGVLRDLVKAMCLDSFRDLRVAWDEIQEQGGEERQPDAMQAFERFPGEPHPVDWRTVPDVLRNADRHDVLREWTLFFRASYREARNRLVSPPAGG
jgi:ABC-type Fe3+ transport system substrate-binding protein